MPLISINIYLNTQLCVAGHLSRKRGVVSKISSNKKRVLKHELSNFQYGDRHEGYLGLSQKKIIKCWNYPKIIIFYLITYRVQFLPQIGIKVTCYITTGYDLHSMESTGRSLERRRGGQNLHCPSFKEVPQDIFIFFIFLVWNFKKEV